MFFTKRLDSLRNWNIRDFFQSQNPIFSEALHGLDFHKRKSFNIFGHPLTV